MRISCEVTKQHDTGGPHAGRKARSTLAIVGCRNSFALHHCDMASRTGTKYEVGDGKIRKFEFKKFKEG